MIFCNFIPGTKLEPDERLPTGGVAGECEQSLYYPFGASSDPTESTIERLVRLVRVSSSKLMRSPLPAARPRGARARPTRRHERPDQGGRRDEAARAQDTSDHATDTPLDTSARAEGAAPSEREGGEAISMSNEQQQMGQVATANVNTTTNTSWQFSCKFTRNDVQLHSSLDDCWTVIFDKVYNITEFVNDHPGGDFILLEYAGRDATHAFLSSRHGSSAYKMLDIYWIGILVDEELCYSNNSSYCSVYSNLSWRDAISPSSAALSASAAAPASSSAPSSSSSPLAKAITQSSSSASSSSALSDSAIHLAEEQHTREAKSRSGSSGSLWLT